MFVCNVLALAGCISSEGTGAGDRAKNPVQIFNTIDTTYHEVSRNAVSQSKVDTTKLAKPTSLRVASKFKSKQDTLRAAVVKRSKSVLHARVKIERPEHPVFTVQIGTFSQASNALRTQKRAKELFANQPIFNHFIKSAKLYRVSIGRYEERGDAFALLDTMKQTYPKEYSQCWINFLP
jgi:cell division septation protein DedD